MIAHDAVYGLAFDTLSAVEAWYAGNPPPELAELPARRYISPGAPAWDCALLAVWCDNTNTSDGVLAQAGLQQQGAAAGFSFRVATMVLELVRCAPMPPPNGGAPPIEEEQNAALTLYSDGVALANAVVDAHRAGLLGHCSSVQPQGWRVLGPEGGLVGGQLRVLMGME